MGINVTLRGGSGDMIKAVYDPNLDGIIAVAQTEANLIAVVKHDIEVSETGNAYAKKKTFTFLEDFRGELGVTFETKHSSGGATVHAKVYKNGVAIGTEKNTVSTSFVKHTDYIDFGLIAAGETVELWLYPDAGAGIAYAKNFRLTQGLAASIS